MEYKIYLFRTIDGFIKIVAGKMNFSINKLKFPFFQNVNIKNSKRTTKTIKNVPQTVPQTVSPLTSNKNSNRFNLFVFCECHHTDI